MDNHLFNIKRIGSDFLLSLVYKKIDEYLVKLDKKMPNLELGLEEFLDKKYHQLADLISKGDNKVTVDNLNIVKDNYPEVYNELQKRVYKTGEVGDMETMHDMGFSD